MKIMSFIGLLSCLLLANCHAVQFSNVVQLVKSPLFLTAAAVGCGVVGRTLLTKAQENRKLAKRNFKEARMLRNPQVRAIGFPEPREAAGNEASRAAKAYSLSGWLFMAGSAACAVYPMVKLYRNIVQANG